MASQAMRQGFSIPMRTTSADKLIRAIHKHGPMTMDEGIAVHMQLGRNRTSTISIYRKALESGWIEQIGPKYHLRPHVQIHLDSKPVKNDGPKELVPPMTRPFKAWSGKYDFANDRLNRDRSFKNASTAPSEYWTEA